MKLHELFGQERDQEVEAVLRAAVEADPANAEHWWNLGEAILIQGRYPEGFRFTEARPDRLKSMLLKSGVPEWEGGPLAGRSILVYGEQGIGDEIMFSRFIPALRRLGASRISLAVLSVNARALRQIGADEVIARDGGTHIPTPDCWVMLGSLPHRLGVSLENLSGRPYLTASPRGRGGVAIVERGSPAHKNDRNRSMPAGLLQSAFPRATLLEPVGDTLDSLERLAALDLLITADTSWAHMAGALGVPCWVLLAHGYVDWRWMRRRSDSPWYDSLRLFRQPMLGDWGSVVDHLTRLTITRPSDPYDDPICAVPAPGEYPLTPLTPPPTYTL